MSKGFLISGARAFRRDEAPTRPLSPWTPSILLYVPGGHNGCWRSNSNKLDTEDIRLFTQTRGKVEASISTFGFCYNSR